MKKLIPILFALIVAISIVVAQPKASSAYANYASTEHPFENFKVESVQQFVLGRKAQISQNDANTWCNMVMDTMRTVKPKGGFSLIFAKDGYKLILYPFDSKPYTWAHMMRGECVFNK